MALEPVTPSTAEVATNIVRYRVLIERGLALQADEFAAGVASVLSRETGWAGQGIRFARVDEGHDLTVVLAQPRSVDRLCRPLRTGGRLSCAIAGRAVINAKRWREGAKTWGSDIAGYHHYLINHEVGHVLGLRHVGCPAPGMPAPIMLPQTKFLNGCKANGVATPRDLAMFSRVLPGLRQRISAAERLPLGSASTKRIEKSKRRARKRRSRRRRRR